MSTRDAPLEMWNLYFSERSNLSTAEFSKSRIFEEVVHHYQYLVEAVARKLEYNLPTYVEDADLLSLGQIGLLRALSKYILDKGPFSRYASTVIYGAIIDGLRAYDFAPRGLRKQQRLVEEAKKSIHKTGVPFPSEVEIALHLGVTVEEVRDINHKVARSDICPTDPAFLPDGFRVEEYDTWLICHSFVLWLQEYPRQTQEVICLKYWAGLPNNAISSTLGIATEVVKELHQSVILELLPFMEELVSTG